MMQTILFLDGAHLEFETVQSDIEEEYEII
jgi:hypothetical protein